MPPAPPLSASGSRWRRRDCRRPRAPPSGGRRGSPAEDILHLVVTLAHDRFLKSDEVRSKSAQAIDIAARADKGTIELLKNAVNLTGTPQMDRIYGLGAADTISGRAGNDDCYGGSGADEISCRNGNDRIDGGFGEDVLFGGSGNDTILAADGQVDQVDCGLGDNDTAYVDELDDVVNCENVFVATPEVTM